MQNINIVNPFALKLNGFERVRYLRPDLVLKEKEEQIEKFYEPFPIKDLRQGKQAYGVKFNNYQDLKNNYPEICDKYYEICKEEPNPRTGKTFRYMFSEDLKYFEQFVLDKIRSISFSYIKIIDYKYMRVSDYEKYSPNDIDANNENKVKDDIQKQLIYEWTVQQNWEVKTESEFWIPYFSNNLLDLEEIHIATNFHFKQSKIRLVKINFKRLQNFYIKQKLV